MELPLGVGRKTLIASGPVGSDKTSRYSATDVEKVLAAAETTTSVPVSMSSSLIMAVDAAALKASQVPTTSSRSSAAMHSLMEQGKQIWNSRVPYLNLFVFRRSRRAIPRKAFTSDDNAY